MLKQGVFTDRGFMKQVQLVFTLCLVVGSLFLGACSKQNHNEQSSEEYIHYLIDQGRHAEAIEESKKLYDREPSDQHRMLLASTYAMRGGVQLRSVIKEVKNNYDLQLKDVSVSQLWQGVFGFSWDLSILNDEDTATLKQFLVTLRSFQLLWSALPEITAEQRADAKKAVDLLAENPSQNNGISVYRTYLLSVLVKNEIQKSVMELKTIYSRKACQSDIRPLLVRTWYVLGSLIEFYESAKTVRGVNTEEYQNKIAELRLIQNKIAKFLYELPMGYSWDCQ